MRKQSRSEILEILFNNLMDDSEEVALTPEIEGLVRLALSRGFREGQLSKMFGDDYYLES